MPPAYIRHSLSDEVLGQLTTQHHRTTLAFRLERCTRRSSLPVTPPCVPYLSIGLACRDFGHDRFGERWEGTTWRWVKRMISQISSLSPVAVRGHPEHPSRPLVRGNAMTMPCVHHHSVRVHVRGRDLGSRLWTTMSRGACERMLGKWGYSLRWADGKVHHRCPADVVEVALDVVCLRFAHTIHILFFTGLNGCLRCLFAFPRRGTDSDRSRGGPEGFRRAGVLRNRGNVDSYPAQLLSGPAST